MLLLRKHFPFGGLSLHLMVSYSFEWQGPIDNSTKQLQPLHSSMTWGKVKPASVVQFHNQFWNQFCYRFWDQTWNQIWDWFWNQFLGQFWDQFWNQFIGQIWDQFWNQFWNQSCILEPKLRYQFRGQFLSQFLGQYCGKCLKQFLTILRTNVMVSY